jgi:endonuclease G, mitochondrial
MYRKRLLLVPLSLLIVSTFTAFSASSPLGKPAVAPHPQASVSIHLTLGNPSDATTSVTDKRNFLMVKPQFVLSYNNFKGGPNWVSWHLQAEDVGNVDRSDSFHPDPDLPEGFKRVVTGNYTNSGFERGHLCNSKDRTDTEDNNFATFAMTNILPQKADNNKGPWKALEMFSRKLLDEGNELYIVAGAFGTKGTIARHTINVPRIFWKVIIVLPDGRDDVNRIDASTRAIAVCMPNIAGIRRKDWRGYVSTIRNIETATGFDLLSELSTRVQNALETRRDAEGTTPARANPCR